MCAYFQDFEEHEKQTHLINLTSFVLWCCPLLVKTRNFQHKVLRFCCQESEFWNIPGINSFVGASLWPREALIWYTIKWLRIIIIKIQKGDPNLAEGDVLVGPEVLVPVLRVLPQVSETFLQLGFILWDVIHNWPEVGKWVWWPDPVVRGAGFWSDGRSLQVHINSWMWVRDQTTFFCSWGWSDYTWLWFKAQTFGVLSFCGARLELQSRTSTAESWCGRSGERGAKRPRSVHLRQAAVGWDAISK